MAVTGLLLIGFVVGHMAGNLLVYAGRDALNTYAQALKANPGLLWAARLALLLVFVVHVLLGLLLAFENKTARPSRYVYEDTLQATWASRNMLLTGLVLLAFVVYHLAHFTLGWVKKAEVQSVRGELVALDRKDYLDLSEVRRVGDKAYVPVPTWDYRTRSSGDIESRHDVYSMVIDGFRTWWISVSYLVAMAFLGLHLWHGGSSFLQSLGLNSFRFKKLVAAIGPTLAVIVVVGNCSIPIAVWLEILK